MRSKWLGEPDTFAYSIYLNLLIMPVYAFPTTDRFTDKLTVRQNGYRYHCDETHNVTNKQSFLNKIYLLKFS